MYIYLANTKSVESKHLERFDISTTYLQGNNEYCKELKFLSNSQKLNIPLVTVEECCFQYQMHSRVQITFRLKSRVTLEITKGTLCTRSQGHGCWIQNICILKALRVFDSSLICRVSKFKAFLDIKINGITTIAKVRLIKNNSK